MFIYFVIISSVWNVSYFTSRSAGRHSFVCPSMYKIYDYLKILFHPHFGYIICLIEECVLCD